MIAIPMLQVALDYISLPPVLAMALQVADEVDIIEIGRPGSQELDRGQRGSTP